MHLVLHVVLVRETPSNHHSAHRSVARQAGDLESVDLVLVVVVMAAP